MRGAAAGPRYVIALAGWGAMLIAPVVTWSLLRPLDDVVVSVETAAPVDDSHVHVPRSGDIVEYDQLPADDGTQSTSRVAAGPVDGLAVIESDPVEAVTAAPASDPTWAELLNALIAPWLNTLVTIWCVGMCLFTARSARGWTVVRRLLHHDIAAVPDEQTSLLARVARQVGIKYRVRLLQSPHVDVPVAIGWLRPVILLPVCVATGFSPTQLEGVLAHELAHIRRHDYLINLLQNLSETVFFYHPALWWASAVVRREREHCCDELAARALGNRAEYGRALLALEELRGAAPAFAVGAKTGSLLERIRRLGQLEPTPRLTTGGVVGIVLVAAVVVSAAVWGASVSGDRDANSVAVIESDAETEQASAYATAVAEKFAAVAAEQNLPFLGDTEIAALRTELHEYLANRVRQDPSDEIQELAVDAIAARTEQICQRQGAYLHFRGDFNMLCWQLWLLAERRELTVVENEVREAQREWMRAYVRALPPAEKADRFPQYSHAARLKLLEDEVFRNPLSPFFHEPMSEDDFTKFQATLEERNGGNAKSRVIYAPAHIFYAAVETLHGAWMKTHPPGFPVSGLSVGDTAYFSFARSRDGGFDSTVAHGLALFDLDGDLAKAGTIVDDTALPAESRGSQSVAEYPDTDVRYDPATGLLDPVNGGRFAVLDTNEWNVADRIPLADLRRRIEKEAVDSYSLAEIQELTNVDPSAATRAIGRLPILVVETGDAKIVTMRITDLIAGTLSVQVRPRPLAPNPPFHLGDVEARSAGIAYPRKPFVVRGRVTDENQQPLSGVEVVAHTGMGTLRRTGTAITGDDGTYTLRFGPGILMQHSESAPLNVGVQVATISPRLNGWYEVNFHQQGNLGIADHPLNDEERKTWAGYKDIVQPETPYELSFVMARGATIEGRFLNEFGRPVAGESVWLDGEELPPSSSVLDSAETDDEGRFRFDGVPLNRDWHFTVRVHGTRHEIAGEAFQFEKPETREFKLTLLTDESTDGKAEFRLEQAQERANDRQRVKAAEPADDNRVHMNLIAAQHVLLLEGREIVTWEDVEAKIKALPDPSRARPHLYFTRGAMEAGRYEAARKEVGRLDREYDLDGYSVGSLQPRTAAHYDRIAGPDDLIPDPALRREGTIVDIHGDPVAGAEVVLITPVDESMPYKAYDVYVVSGRVRNPLDEVLTHTDETGRFAVYPPKETPFSVLALHPDVGIALVESEWFEQDQQVKLIPWGSVVAEFSEEPEDQSASLRTRLDVTDTRPEVSITQYWSDLKRDDPTLVFEFTHVPPIWPTHITRDFRQPDGGSFGLGGASISILPGETRKIALGPVTQQQRDLLKARVRELDELRGGNR